MNHSYMRSFILVILYISPLVSFSQIDTLLWQDFENPLFLDFEVSDSINAPLNLWLNLDLDSAQDAINRPNAWFPAFAFSSIDSGNRVMQSSSWLSNPSIRTENWLISPLILPAQGETILIEWKSAPRQAPQYLDGYRVMYSSTGRDPEDFYTIKQLSEHVGPASDSSGMGPVPTYSWFEFSLGGDIHGIDGQHIQLPANMDSTAYIGELWRPDVISFPAYTHDTLYLAIVHDSQDDNLLAIDDILVLGTSAVTLKENKLDGIRIYPNPTTSFLILELELESMSEPIVLFDALGRSFHVPMTRSEKGIKLDLRKLTSGVYWIRFDQSYVSFVRE